MLSVCQSVRPSVRLSVTLCIVAITATCDRLSQQQLATGLYYAVCLLKLD